MIAKKEKKVNRFLQEYLHFTKKCCIIVHVTYLSKNQKMHLF